MCLHQALTTHPIHLDLATTNVDFFTCVQGRPALVFGDAVYLRLASNPAEEAAAAIVAMRSTQALLALPPSFFKLLTAVRQPCLLH